MIFYFFRLTLVLFITIVLTTVTILLGIFDRHGKRVYWINRLWTWLVLRIARISLTVHGLENLDPSEQYVFMVNHQSNIDIPVLVQSLTPFQLRWIAKKELLWVPLFGWAMWATKHIIVNRSDAGDARKSLERAKRRMAAGISVVVFPEGTRSHDGKLLPFKKGGFLLALQTGKNIVPVTINGSGQLLPSGDWRLHSGNVEVIVEKPIMTKTFRVGSIRSLSDRVRQAIAAHLHPLGSFADGRRKSSVQSEYEPGIGETPPLNL
ncbi:MAG TPA: lysophospholipid acyltransferase family protein [Candidatus Binatia bacterium]